MLTPSREKEGVRTGAYYVRVIQPREGWWVEAKAIAFQSVEHCASSRVMECNSPSECV